MYGSDITMSSATPSAAALRTAAPKQKKTRRRNRLDDEPRYYANTMGEGSGVAKVQSRFARKINDWGRRRRKAMKARRAQGNMNVIVATQQPLHNNKVSVIARCSDLERQVWRHPQYARNFCDTNCRRYGQRHWRDIFSCVNGFKRLNMDI